MNLALGAISYSNRITSAWDSYISEPAVSLPYLVNRRDSLSPAAVASRLPSIYCRSWRCWKQSSEPGNRWRNESQELRRRKHRSESAVRVESSEQGPLGRLRDEFSLDEATRWTRQNVSIQSFTLHTGIRFHNSASRARRSDRDEGRTPDRSMAPGPG